MTDLSAISIKPVLTLAEAAAYAGVSEITVKRLCLKINRVEWPKVPWTGFELTMIISAL